MLTRTRVRVRLPYPQGWRAAQAGALGGAPTRGAAAARAGDITVVLEVKVDLRDGAAWGTLDRVITRFEGAAADALAASPGSSDAESEADSPGAPRAAWPGAAAVMRSMLRWACDLAGLQRLAAQAWAAAAVPLLVPARVGDRRPASYLPRRTQLRACPALLCGGAVRLLRASAHAQLSGLNAAAFKPSACHARAGAPAASAAPQGRVVLGSLRKRFAHGIRQLAEVAADRISQCGPTWRRAGPARLLQLLLSLRKKCEARDDARVLLVAAKHAIANVNALLHAAPAYAELLAVPLAEVGAAPASNACAR